MPVMTVAPVVVNPDNDSNAASVRDRCGCSASTSGMAPVRPSPAQNRTTTTKPSRSFNSFFIVLTGNHRIKPRTRIMMNEIKNAPCEDSSIHQAINNGGNCVRLNSDRSMPSIRWMTVACMLASGRYQRKVIPTWNIFSTSWTCFLSATRSIT